MPVRFGSIRFTVPGRYGSCRFVFYGSLRFAGILVFEGQPKRGFICRSSFDSDVFGEFVGNSARIKVVWNVFCEISVNSADL